MQPLSARTWQDLNGDYQLDWEFDSALEGNVALTGEIDIRRQSEFTLGLAFGDRRHAAVTILMQSLSIPFQDHRRRYIEQWHRASSTMQALEGTAGDGGRLYLISESLLLAHEDKTYAGAMIASASIPWGQAKGDEDLGGARIVAPAPAEEAPVPVAEPATPVGSPR